MAKLAQYAQYGQHVQGRISSAADSNSPLFRKAACCSESVQPSAVGKKEEQLCYPATTDTCPRFTSPEPGTCSISWCQAEGLKMGDQPPTQWAVSSPRVVVAAASYGRFSNLFSSISEAIHAKRTTRCQELRSITDRAFV